MTLNHKLVDLWVITFMTLGHRPVDNTFMSLGHNFVVSIFGDIFGDQYFEILLFYICKFVQFYFYKV